MGLRVYVYLNAEFGGNCTMDGVTKRFRQLTLTNVEGPFEPTLDAPGAKLVENGRGMVRIVPEEVAHRWTMAGGNYAATSDSRFTQAVEKITGGRFYGAVAVHDRVENIQDADRIADVVNYLRAEQERQRGLDKAAREAGRHSQVRDSMLTFDPTNLLMLGAYMEWDVGRVSNALAAAKAAHMIAPPVNPA